MLNMSYGGAGEEDRGAAGLPAGGSEQGRGDQAGPRDGLTVCWGSGRDPDTALFTVYLNVDPTEKQHDNCRLLENKFRHDNFQLQKVCWKQTFGEDCMN